jgi:hypothetical protein
MTDDARNKKVWRLLEANCNADEIAEYFHITIDAAFVWMASAKKWAKKKL